MKYVIKDNYKTDYRQYDDSDSTKDYFTVADPFVIELWDQILITYGDWNVISVRSADDIENNFFGFVKQFTSILDLTYDRYTTVLRYYQRQKSYLMKQLEEVSTTEATGESERRYNDTPQTNDEGNVDENYMTDYTKNNDETKGKAVRDYDPATPMARLSEIQSQYEETLRSWVNEFRDLFWPGGDEL